ncbi:TIGR00341 family protein [Halobacteriales archaeon Cl-PHB]
MRVIRTLVSDEKLEDVLATLEDNDIDYVVVHEESDRDDPAVVEFPLPTQAVEAILEELRAVRGDDGAYTVVSSAETVFSEHIDEMEDRFITGDEEDDSIATEEIRSMAIDMTPGAKTYFAMTLLSALVATAGLLLNSPAIVVGSMVIAPLVGSALTASLGTVLDERSLVLDGLKTQVLGLAVAILGATLFSYGLKSVAFLPPAVDVSTTQQISQRISPGFLSTVVGAAAGAAGAFGLATGVSVTLVGVMIAAALIPAAAAVGIGIAWGIRSVAAGAFFLLVLNAIAIHLAGAAVLWYLGYRPEDWGLDGPISSLSSQQAGSLALTAVVFGGVFVGFGGVVATHIAFEQDVNQAATDVVSADDYGDLELLSVHSEFDAQLVTSQPAQQVTVVVSRPVDRAYPDLSQRLADRIASATDRQVSVTVEFVDRQTAEASGAATGLLAPGVGRLPGR